MIDKAVLGGGCFWCTEAIFNLVRGVTSVLPGYAGGTFKNPTYEHLHKFDTGHAEVIEISFDKSVVSYRELLEIFIAIHDPTTPNQQCNDIGPEYRSIILFSSDEQKKIAEEVLESFAKTMWQDPIVTEVKPLDIFWPAEDYHRNYFENNPEQAYCQIIINPKLAKFRKSFAHRLKN